MEIDQRIGEHPVEPRVGEKGADLVLNRGDGFLTIPGVVLREFISPERFDLLVPRRIRYTAGCSLAVAGAALLAGRCYLTDNESRPQSAFGLPVAVPLPAHAPLRPERYGTRFV